MAVERNSFLSGGGELGALMRGFDWATSPLGPPESWPQSLKTAVRIMLTSRQPIWIGWGEELIYLYNDPYKSIIGGKHPRALGQPTRVVWNEIWPDIGPLLATAMRGDAGTYVEDQLLIMERNGYPEETYYTYSYSPIPADDGSAGGIICANTDGTQGVIGERQITLLRELAARTSDTRTRAEVCQRAAEALATNGRDLPFALIYLPTHDGAFQLIATAGIDAGGAAAPRLIGANERQPWAIGEVLHADELRLLKHPAHAADLPTGSWDIAPHQVVIAPIPGTGEQGNAGALVAGLNPFRLFDENYRGFLNLVTSQIGSAIANAEAYEAERARAEALAQIDRAKTAFFSNVSHEFRTPLTLMIGPLEDALAAGRDMPAKQRERLDLVHRNSLRLQRLVNSLLDFSRIEAGRARACFRPTDLAALTRDLASSFQAATDKAGLTLTLETPPLRHATYVDRDMWEKIVLNLLSNAFKFTLHGGITVRLAESAVSVTLTIADTGIGVPPEELPRLFERFHRVEGASGRSHEGSGIGLALVSDLVRLHGGQITVQSEPGRGTAFAIELPHGRDHLPADQVLEDAEAGTATARASAFVEEALRWLPEHPGGNDSAEVVADIPAGTEATRATADPRRIVLADDNADLRAYIARLLRERGHAVEPVEDGESALCSVRASRPDLLITDVMMPRLDGFGLLREIRQDPALQDLSVIMLSARSGEEARVEGLDAGADDYLVKPFSARELMARVDSCLAMNRLRRTAAAALQQLNEQLESRVAQEIEVRRQAELSLQQAQKMESIGQLTGGIAHDFNNLLQVISGNLQLLAMEVAGNGRAEMRVQNALTGVSRGSKLAAQLLAFGRRQPLEPKVVNIGRFIRGMDDLLRRSLGEEIEIESTVSGGLWNTFADPGQIENALLNLAINARDAMSGRGRLTIEVGNAFLNDEYTFSHPDVSPGQYVLLAVSDTGTGIAPEILDKVFEPFFTTKTEGRGTGLGLSMVYGFAKQSGGHVKIYSEPGMGTTVKLYLPRSAHSEDLVVEVSQQAVVGGSEIVLVVEDDEQVRATAVEMLADLGYRVLKAADADSALAVVESGVPVDLLFTDVVMPGTLRSPELARRARERLPDIAVLFTSGYTENAIVHGGRLDEGVNLLAKPYTREALSRKIRHVIGNQRQRMAANASAQTQVPPPVPSRTVLLVEDDDLIRLNTADMLRELGCRVREAASAEEALEVLGQGPVDALITDVRLPGLSGLELARKVRALHPEMGVAFATGRDHLPDGPDGAMLLRKPYDSDALASCLQRLVGSAR